MYSRKIHNKQHGDTVSKKKQRVFMFFADQYKKGARHGSVLRATCVTTQNRVVSHPAVVQIG